VPHDRLCAFGGPFEVGDEQTGCRMAQQVEIIAMLAGLVAHATIGCVVCGEAISAREVRRPPQGRNDH
jgi:hypothetical protein